MSSDIKSPESHFPRSWKCVSNYLILWRPLFGMPYPETDDEQLEKWYVADGQSRPKKFFLASCNERTSKSLCNKQLPSQKTLSVDRWGLLPFPRVHTLPRQNKHCFFANFIRWINFLRSLKSYAEHSIFFGHFQPRLWGLRFPFMLVHRKINVHEVA